MLAAAFGVEMGEDPNRPCDEEQRDACLNEVGEDNLEFACAHCKRRSQGS